MCITYKPATTTVNLRMEKLLFKYWKSNEEI